MATLKNEVKMVKLDNGFYRLEQEVFLPSGSLAYTQCVGELAKEHDQPLWRVYINTHGNLHTPNGNLYWKFNDFRRFLKEGKLQELV